MAVPEPPTQFQLRVKTWTAVATAGAFVACLLYDWDSAVGHKTVFSGVRPAIKRVMNKVYGVDQ
jgi:hypothetical protein